MRGHCAEKWKDSMTVAIRSHRLACAVCVIGVLGVSHAARLEEPVLARARVPVPQQSPAVDPQTQPPPKVEPGKQPPAGIEPRMTGRDNTPESTRPLSARPVRSQLRKELDDVVNKAASARFATRERLPSAEVLGELQSARPKALGAFADADDETRLAAILAVGNIDLATSPSKRFGADFLDRLARMYPTDESARVRTEIVKTFALMPVDQASQSTRSVILAGLVDPSVGARQYGIFGASRLKLDEALPIIADSLEAPEVSLRIAAAAALGLYGTRATRYLGALQLAAVAEQDGPTRQTMLGSVRLISAQK